MDYYEHCSAAARAATGVGEAKAQLASSKEASDEIFFEEVERFRNMCMRQKRIKNSVSTRASTSSQVGFISQIEPAYNQSKFYRGPKGLA